MQVESMAGWSAARSATTAGASAPPEMRIHLWRYGVCCTTRGLGFSPYTSLCVEGVASNLRAAKPAELPVAARVTATGLDVHQGGTSKRQGRNITSDWKGIEKSFY